MVSPNMGLAPYNITEEIIYPSGPNNFRRFEKTVAVNGEWENRVFYEIRPHKYEYEAWLTKHYGQPNYQHTWWVTHNSFVMRDNVYTHWRLSF